MFKDKTLMITGGTGSFGNAVLKRFLDTDIKEIRIFSRDEKNRMICVTSIKPNIQRWHIRLNSTSAMFARYKVVEMLCPEWIISSTQQH